MAYFRLERAGLCAGVGRYGHGEEKDRNQRKSATHESTSWKKCLSMGKIPENEANPIPAPSGGV